MHPRLFIGTGGYSVWCSDDGGVSLRRLLTDTGLYSESRVYALAPCPDARSEILTGTDSGMYRLDGANLTFKHQPSEMDAMSVWSIAYSPADPRIVLAGCRPAGIFRSVDGGRTWQRTMSEFPATCPFLLIPRVTKIHFSPLDPTLVWASLELGGIWRSEDAGLSWTRRNEGLVSDDVHDVTASPHRVSSVFAATNEGLHVSRDGGDRWTMVPLDVPTPYFRTVRALAEGGTLLLGNGDGPPGSVGTLLRSLDDGESWQHVAMPERLDSTLYAIAVNPDNPRLVFAATALGQFLRSEDAGATWHATPRRLGEVRSLAWVPV